MDETALKMTMLFDFFGELLTEKQREYFDLYHNEDLSLSEIAEQSGISRQGVHDIIARAEKTLDEIERKTGVVKRWLYTREMLEQAEALADELLTISYGGKKYFGIVQKLTMTLERIKQYGI